MISALDRQIAASPEYADLVPSQIVPKLADEDKYIASESTLLNASVKGSYYKHRYMRKLTLYRISYIIKFKIELKTIKKGARLI